MNKAVLMLAVVAALVLTVPHVSSAMPMVASSALKIAATTASPVEKIEYGWPYGGGYPYRYWDRWSYGRGWPHGGGYRGYYRYRSSYYHHW